MQLCQKLEITPNIKENMLRILILCSCCLILRSNAQQGLPLPDEFPGLRFIPKTSFDCKTRPVGYYADPDPATRCQVYHMCDMKGNKFSYLCPNGTLFHQQHLICAHWYQVNCTRTLSLYEINKQMFPFDKFEPDDQENSSQTTSPAASSYRPQPLQSRRTNVDITAASKPGTPRQGGKATLVTNRNTVTSKFYDETLLEPQTILSDSAVETEEPLVFKRTGGKRKSSFPRRRVAVTLAARKVTSTTESAQRTSPSLETPDRGNAVLQLDDQLLQESTITASPALPPQTFTTDKLAFGRRYSSRRRSTRVVLQEVPLTTPPSVISLSGDNDNRGNNIPPLQHTVRTFSPVNPGHQFSQISPRRTSSKTAWKTSSSSGQAPPGTEQFGIQLGATAPAASSTLDNPDPVLWVSDTATSQPVSNYQVGSITQTSQRDSAAEINVGEEFINHEFGATIPIAIETNEQQRKNTKLTMKFPKDGRFQKKYGAVAINEKCPQCNPYFLKNDRCSPCVIIR